MFKWCPINRRKENVVVWEGKVLGAGKPIINVTVDAGKEVIILPRPKFKMKVIKP